MPFVYYPALAQPEVLAESQRMCQAMSVACRVASTSMVGTSGTAAAIGTPAILIERGGQSGCSPEDQAAYRDDLLSILAELGCLERPVTAIPGRWTSPRPPTTMLKPTAAGICCASPARNSRQGMPGTPYRLLRDCPPGNHRSLGWVCAVRHSGAGCPGRGFPAGTGTASPRINRKNSGSRDGAGVF